MEFADFEIRAWRKGADRVQVLVHRAPAGETATPAEVRVSAGRLKVLAAIERPARRNWITHSRRAVAKARPDLAAMLPAA